MSLRIAVPHSILEHIPIAVLAVDIDGNIIAGNQRAGTLLSCSPAQLEGRHLGEILNLAATSPPLAELLEQATSLCESRQLYIRPQQQPAIPVKLDCNKPSTDTPYTLITLQDISEQLTWEQQIKAREQIYRGMFENELVGLYRTDISSGRLLECNERLAQMFGYDSREQMMAEYRAPDHYVDQQDRANLVKILRSTNRVDDFEAELYRKDGSARWFRYTGTINEADNYLEGFVTDVTDEHQVRQELLLTASAFNGTSEGILITNAARRVLRVNQAFSDITGYSQEDMLGHSAHMLSSDRHDRDFYETIWAQIGDHDHWSGEIWVTRKDGSIFTAWHNISVVRDGTGKILQYIIIFCDITERKEAEERIARLAHYDALTGLPNRLLFKDRCDHAMSKARRDQHAMAVLFLDLDGFKDINDSLGHPVGDRVLQVLAARINEVIREEDTVARLGGDEFTVIIEELDKPQDAAIVAETLLDSIRTGLTVEGHQFHLSASIGISVFPEDGEDATILVSNADAAMYRAKEQGRNNYQFYTRELTTSAFERVWLEGQMREAVAREELTLVYQPQLSLSQDRPVGVEALLRWKHPESGMIAPDRFVPVAEKCGLILPIGSWVLEQSCRQAAQWLKDGVKLDRIAVNVSGAQVQREDFVAVVKAALDSSGLKPQYLELEVTESFIMKQADEAIRTLEGLRELGVSLAIDDFGTGYSSLSYLKRLPINRLKVDKSFVRDVPENSNDEAIIRAIIALGHSLQLDIIAEGVETLEQQEFLIAQGCDEVQGYLYSKPLSADKTVEFINQFVGRQAPAGQNFKLFPELLG